MMEMNKVWDAADYKALMKRLNYAAGMISNTEEPSEEVRNLAQSCKIFLEIYEAKTSDGSERLPVPRERFIAY